jgi:BTB/POZ domain
MKLKTGQDLLVYLYNRRLHEGSDLRGLLAAADKYDIRELKIWCATALAASVSTANYAELLHLAQLYKVPALKAVVLQYIVRHVNHL